MNVPYRSKLVDLEVHLHASTAKAILVSLDGDKKKAVWLPLSLCEVDTTNDPNLIITLHESVAIDKGLV